jgi:cell division protein FtsW
MIRMGGFPDRRLLFITLLLVGVGVVMVYCSSTYRATLAGGAEFSIAARHTLRAVLGIVLMLVAACVPYRTSCRIALYTLPVALALLAVTVVGSASVKQAHGIPRWISLFGVVVQPVELVKLSLALSLPWWIDHHPESTTQLRWGFVKLLAVPAVVLMLLALQPNFGSAMALSIMTLAVFWLAGVKRSYVFTLAAGGALLCWLGYLHVDKLHDRVEVWLSLLLTGTGQGELAYQSIQGLTALGSGGLLGVGPGMSTMKYLFLPAGHTDFIFAILGEELGFVGTCGLVLVLGLWTARAMKIALRAPDGLGYLVALSLTCMILCYATLNLAVAVALIPVTGLPLPFLSYGGSAMVSNLAGVGVLLNVGRSVRQRSAPTDRWRGWRA